MVTLVSCNMLLISQAMWNYDFIHALNTFNTKIINLFAYHKISLNTTIFESTKTLWWKSAMHNDKELYLVNNHILFACRNFEGLLCIHLGG